MYCSVVIHSFPWPIYYVTFLWLLCRAQWLWIPLFCVYCVFFFYIYEGHFLLNIVIQIESCVSKIKIHYSMVSLSLDYLLVTGIILIDLPLCATLCFSLVAFKTCFMTYCLNSTMCGGSCLIFLFSFWEMVIVVASAVFFSVFHSKTSFIWVPLSLDLQNFLLWFYLIFSMLFVCSSPVIHTFCLLMEFCASHIFWSNSKCVSLLFECSNHLSCLQTLIFFFSLVHSAAEASSEVFSLWLMELFI